MISYLEKKISDIDDLDFQMMVSELCECIEKSRAEFDSRRLSFMLTVIARDYPKYLSKQYLSKNGILTRKFDSFSTDSVVYQVCKELVDLNRMGTDWFCGKSVLSLIKACSKFYCPKQMTRSKKPTRNQLRNEFQTALIIQKRLNDVL